jgi:hypothetical protein
MCVHCLLRGMLSSHLRTAFRVDMSECVFFDIDLLL